MRKTKKVKKSVEVLAKVTCNKCGGSLRSSSAGAMGFYGLCTEVRGHYFSDHLEDGMKYNFDLCESCLLWLFSTFMIPVEKSEYPLNEG